MCAKHSGAGDDGDHQYPKVTGGEGMRILAVDDERHALENLEQAVLEVMPEASLCCCASVEEGLAYARIVSVDVAFLDIEMPGINGLELAQQLKQINGETNIIFVTAHAQYTMSAFTLHASGYVLKPFHPKRVALELENLRFPVREDDRGVRIRCFGSFEVFSDGKPIPFARPKAKEMLAYLIDRQGASVSKREMATILWEAEPYTRSIQSHLHVLYTELLRTLRGVDAEHIILHRRGYYAVDTRSVYCDYDRYCRGEMAAVNSYRGEYMIDYSWAEFTAGALAYQKNNESS